MDNPDPTGRDSCSCFEPSHLPISHAAICRPTACSGKTASTTTHQVTAVKALARGDWTCCRSSPLPPNGQPSNPPSPSARLLNLIIADIYGQRRLLEEGLLPPEVLFANPEFLRPFCDLQMGSQTPMFLYAAELARRADGSFCVMADRSEAPAGPGFALENRIVSSRSMAAGFKQLAVERLAPFFVRLQNSLRRRTARPTDSPRIVLLSSGPGHPYYFEDVYLARYLGYTLVEGGDLAVRSDVVCMKTLSGLVPVDIVMTRCAEAGLDPLELGGYSAHGVPGILNAIRARNVAVVNTPGCGIVGAPVFMPFLPQLCQHLLAEPLLLPSIPSWWCGAPQHLQKSCTASMNSYSNPPSRKAAAKKSSSATSPVSRNPTAAQDCRQSPGIGSLRKKYDAPGPRSGRPMAFAPATSHSERSSSKTKNSGTSCPADSFASPPIPNPCSSQSQVATAARICGCSPIAASNPSLS